MRETELQAFFAGTLDAEALAHAFEGFLVTEGPSQTGRPVCDLPTESPVRLADLVMICDAVLNGRMPPTLLGSIGFFLIACDNFVWNPDTAEGSRISDTVFDWSAPEINYPLTIDNVRRCKEGLGSP